MAKKILCRVLVDVFIGATQYRCNQVIKIDDTTAKSYIKEGQLDPSEAGVKYAMDHEGAEPIDHDQPDFKPVIDQAAIDKLKAEIADLVKAVEKAADADKPGIQQTLDAKRLELQSLEA